MKISQRQRFRQTSVGEASSVVASAKSRSVDIWLQRLAHLTQVGLLALGIFGYFYTVLPVFQNQQLQEQAAKLELEKAAAQRQLDSLVDEQERVSKEIALLRERWEKEKERSAQLSISASAARKQELLATQRAKDAEVALKGQEKTLDAARWELMTSDFFSAYMFRSINAGIRSANRSRRASDSEYWRSQESDWPRPYTALVEAVEAARKNSSRDQVPESYYAELQAFIESRRTALQCTMPDFPGLAASYQLQKAALESTVEAETKANVNKLFELDSAFDKQVRELKKACEDKGIAVYEEFLKLKGVKR